MYLLYIFRIRLLELVDYLTHSLCLLSLADEQDVARIYNHQIFNTDSDSHPLR